MAQETTGARPHRGSRLPLAIALVAGLVGVLAIAAAVAAGGPSGTATGGANAVPLIAAASPSPSPDANGRDGWKGGPGGMPGGPHMGGMRGGVSIDAIDGTKLALRTDDGWTRTIETAGATITKNGSTASVGDLAVGDEIVFQQKRDSDGTYTITSVTVVQPRVGGTVTATGPSSITLKDRDGAVVTVTVSSATTYEVAGKTSATLADVTVGSMVVATGTKNADGSLTATTVRAFTPGRGGPGMDGRRGGRHGGDHRGGPWGGRQDQQNQPNATTPPGA